MVKIRKDRALAELVHTFFKYYVTAVLETAPDYEPRTVKQFMLEHFERIGNAYNQEAFYAIARMNFEGNQVESAIRASMKPETTAMDLVRFACRTEECFNTMVEEYKRNFMTLLEGRLESREEYEKSYTRCEALGMINQELAVNIINRMAERAYEIGKQSIKNQS